MKTTVSSPAPILRQTGRISCLAIAFLLLFSPLFWRGAGGEAFSQNTFRRKICNNLDTFPNWRLTSNNTNEYALYNVAPISIAHQIPSDSGYVYFATAFNYKNNTSLSNSFSATKLDKYGNLEWFKAYEGGGVGIGKQLFEGITTTDSGFVMAGELIFGQAGGSGTIWERTTIIQKTDKNGQIVWAKTYNVDSPNNIPIKIRQMPDSGFIVVGQTRDDTYSGKSFWATTLVSYDIYLLRIDKNGNTVWSYKYDAGDYGEETPSSIDITIDGGFIIGGYAYEGIGNQPDNLRGLLPKTSFIGKQALLMKISATGAIVEWTRRYGTSSGRDSLSFTAGGLWNGFATKGTHVFLETKQASDGGYISVGVSSYSYPDDDYSNNKNQGAWVVKTDASGIIEWQKNYRSIGELNRLELASDGYILVNRGGHTTTDYYGNISDIIKINKTGDVQWIKRYDQEIAGFNLAMDEGFIMAGANIITKTNRLGEFDEGCFYNAAVLTDAGIAIDTAYTLNPKSINLTPANLPVTEITVSGVDICAVSCNISNTPTLPTLWPQTVVCQNTDVTLLFQGGNYSFYKINFGDPASGANNEIEGTPTNTNGAFISHNFASAGTYTMSVIVFNSDYSQSDTVSQKIVVIPQMKYKFSTPEIHVCTKDTVTIAVQFENYTANVYQIGWYPYPFIGAGPTYTLKDSTYTISGEVIADASVKYYTMYYQNNYAGGCEYHDTIRVYAGDIQAFISGDTKICTGGSTTLTAKGGDNYLWSTGAKTPTITVSPTANTTYWVEALTTDGCRDTGYVYVQLVPDINVDVFANNKAVCLGDAVTLYATGAGAINYSWSNGSAGNTIQVVPPQGQTTYMVTGTSGSCTDTASIQITADPKPVVTVSGIPIPANLCAGTYTLTASGAERYYWINSTENNPQYTFVTRQSESGYLSIRSFNGGCAGDAPLIEYNTLYSPSIYGIKADECRVCPGTEVTLRKSFDYSIYSPNPPTMSENQGLSYQWSTGQTGAGTNDSIKVTVTKDTTITLTTTNSFGCKTPRAIFIEASPNFSIKKEVSSVATCANSPTTLYLTGEPLFDFDYDWGNGVKQDTLVVSPLQDSMLYVTATANGCTRTDSIFVYAKSNLPKATITGNALVCKGTPSTYSVSGNAIVTGYEWLSDNSTNPTITISPNNNITLKAVLTFTLGCTDTASYNIQVKTASTPTVSGNTQICPNGTVALTASGGYSYQWNTGSSSNKVQLTTPKDSTISVIISNKGCSNDTIDISITTDKVITATIFSDADTLCSGSALTLIAGGGETYSWSTGEKTAEIGISPSTTTRYEVTAQITADNCADTASITITVKPSPTLSVSGETTLCEGRSTLLQASGNGMGYVWNTGASTASITVNPTKDSTYSASTFIGDCSTTQNYAISVTASTSISAGDDQTVLSGTEITLIPSGGTDYNWSTIDGVLCNNCNTIYDSPTQTTTYYLTETGVICSEDSVTIYVLNCAEVFVPNAFSPNSDGVNDVLYLKNDCIKELDFKIFDRWGNKVFESTDVTTGWDGTYKGELMDAAVFVYYVNAIPLSGNPLSGKGNISLVK